MLTLIVVIAASSFAIFISQRQEASQQQQLLEQKRALENITVLAIDPYMNSSSTSTWESLNFTISSLYTAPANIESVWINGHPLYNGSLYRIGAGGALEKENYSFTKGITLDELEYLYLNITADNFFKTGVTFDIKRNINIELKTELLNTFHVNFVPPSAIMSLELLPRWGGNATGYVTSIVLDGSMSTQPQPGYIMFYEWSLRYSNGTYDNESIPYGCKVFCPVELGEGDEITLTVTNNYGMKAMQTIRYGP